MNPFFGIVYSSDEELENIVVDRYESRRKLIYFLKDLSDYYYLKTKIPISELRVLAAIHAEQLRKEEEELKRAQGKR